MKPIKLAWDDCFPRRNLTGSGVYAARLLEHLTGNQALDLTVFSGWPDGRSGGSLVRRVLKISGNLAWTHLDLPFRLWKGGFEVLHSPAFIAPLRSPCPAVITVHDITYLLYPSHFAAWWVHYMKSVMPVTIKSAAAIICGSEHSRRDLITAYKLPSAKVHVIPYGVEHRQFRQGALLDEGWRRLAGIRDGYVLHVGGFYERKNIPVLLRAVADLRSRGKWADRQLVLAGAEAPGIMGADEIHRTIAELELAANIVLPGRVPDEHLPGLYAQAALVVMPSLYEGFGFPVLEAMAAGTPVVASNTSSLPEIAGDAAILVLPSDISGFADAIGQVLGNAGLAAELRGRGLERARQFTWQRTAAATIDVYRSVAR
ncbi:MAG TPA: glycosyltransferase family 1 protein [Candidatus Sulfotelmatobacter sp.]|nr:glycosyltransferase family 1 protein [Candidatus Sulfotelmatobacter sp.]